MVIAGGTNAVSAGVASALGKVAAVSRAAGADRYATSVAVNAAFAPSQANAYLATGTGYADALSGVALAGHSGAPLYLVQPTCVPSAVGVDLARLGSPQRVLLGGTAALSAAVAAGSVCADWYTKTYGTFTARSVSGAGDQVIALPAGVKGGYVAATFTGSNGAGSWFQVTAQDASKQVTDAVFTASGATYSGTSGWGLFDLAHGGATTLQVRATGSWTVALRPAFEAPVLPASGSGDGLFRFDGPAGSWSVTGARAGAGSPGFVVRQYDGVGHFTVLATSDAATYAGTVNHRAGPALIQVVSGGAWTVR